jgi:hypothetical protein
VIGELDGAHTLGVRAADDAMRFDRHTQSLPPSPGRPS